MGKHKNIGTRKLGEMIVASEPWAALACAMLNLAKNDAQKKGDLSAVSWLLTDGTRLAEMIAPESGADIAITQICNEVVSRVSAGELKHRWGLREY